MDKARDRLPTVYECYGVAPIPKEWLPTEQKLVGVDGADIGLYDTYDAAQFAADNLNKDLERQYKYGVFVVHIDIIQAISRKDDNDGVTGAISSKSSESEEYFDTGT